MGFVTACASSGLSRRILIHKLGIGGHGFSFRLGCGPVGFQLIPPSGVSQGLARLALGQFFRLMAALHTHIFLLHLMDFSVEV